jgi:hypothetical protein
VALFTRPIADISRGTWTTNTGATTNLWAAIDEPEPASDADYVQSSNSANDSYEVRLASVAPALLDRLHILRYRGRKSAAAGNQRGVTVELRQGATVIATNSHPDLTAVFADGLILLTREQGAAITDYADLRVRFTGTGTIGGSGGNRRSVQMSWCQLRVPDSADLLDDWRTRWGVPVEVTTLEQLVDWLRPLGPEVPGPVDPVWMRRYTLAIAVWKLVGPVNGQPGYRDMLEQINAGTYPLAAHQTQQVAAAKIGGKIAYFQTQSDTLDAEDAA